MKRISLSALIASSWGLMGGCSGPGACVDLSASESHAAPGLLAARGALINTDDRGVALQGYDPVAYFTLGAPTRGQEAFRSDYRGATYLFANADHKRQFDADPAKYEPQFGGWCGYAASIQKVSPVNPRDYWEIIDGRLVLQHNRRAWDLWHQDVAGNLRKADANWPGIVARQASATTLKNVDDDGLALEGYDPVAYFTKGTPTRGVAGVEATHNGARYRFASAEHQRLFEANPGKYEPQFGGFCGYAASINKVSPVNPELWQIIEGRLVLQHTPKAYELFNQDAATNLRKADENWPGLSRSRCH